MATIASASHDAQCLRRPLSATNEMLGIDAYWIEGSTPWPVKVYGSPPLNCVCFARSGRQISHHGTKCCHKLDSALRTLPASASLVHLRGHSGRGLPFPGRCADA
jgi:hypothetical protein